MRLEYRMIGPPPDAAPTIVLLHEGLGRVQVWGSFAERACRRHRCRRVRLFARGLRPVFAVEAAAPGLLHARRGARCAPARARRNGFPSRSSARAQRRRLDCRDLWRTVQDHRVRGLVLIAPHFFTEDMGIAEIARAKAAFETGACAPSSPACTSIPTTHSATGATPGSIPSSVSWISRCARPYPRADPDRAGRERPIRHGAADRSCAGRVLLPGRGRAAARHAACAAPGRARGDTAGSRRLLQSAVPRPP